MPEAILFSDAHLSETDIRGADRLFTFVREVCPTAGRVYILGDLFNFWFSPAQARWRPFKQILEALGDLAHRGVEVTFYHGNRDFYFGEELAARFALRVVRDYSIEDLCGQRVLLCHGDMLCTNDVSYHRMRAILAHAATKRFVRSLPTAAARSLAQIYRMYSKRTANRKARWVIGIEPEAVREHFARGADTIVCGHTHSEGRMEFETPEGKAQLFRLGDFGADGSYLVCDGGELGFRRFPTSDGSGGTAQL